MSADSGTKWGSTCRCLFDVCTVDVTVLQLHLFETEHCESVQLHTALVKKVCCCVECWSLYVASLHVHICHVCSVLSHSYIIVVGVGEV